MDPRVLIVGTVPYNTQSTSRAFESYFHGWDRSCLAQIFSHTKTPCKGHCGTLYQITDQRMLKRRFRRTIEPGVVFHYENLPEVWTDGDLEVNNRLIDKLYKIGSTKNSLVYLGRRVVWKKKYWCTEQLDQWLDSFRPECVFLSFSDDFFIPEIAMYVADRYQIPIVSSIGDDYYFNYAVSMSPLYHLYKQLYRRTIRKVFSHPGSAIYIGDKIRDQYNNHFGLNGETVFLTSDVRRRPFAPIDLESPCIAYFGNVRLGRNQSLCDIATALGTICPAYRITVYSNESEEKYCKILKEHPNIDFCGRLPYADVTKKMAKCDVQLVVEGFDEKDVDITRYSLSTKVADSLASGSMVFAYGSPECGAIEYAADTGCITVCTDRAQLKDTLQKLFADQNLQKENYDRAITVTNQNHRLESSTSIFRSVIAKAIGKERAYVKESVELYHPQL